MDLDSKINKFFEKERYWYLLPKKLRFLIWNIKILKKYETKTGKFYLPRFAFKDEIRKKILKNEITDQLIFDALKKYIKPNSIVLDLGANFGQMSILWSKCQSNVEVYAFEASKYVYDILKKNIHANSANVKPMNTLVGNESKKNQSIQKSILKEYSTYGTNKIEKSGNNDKRKTDTIDAIKVDDLNFDKKISAMKIDVQGYDLEALKGAEQTILKHKMAIIFEYEEKFADEFNYTFNDFKEFIEKINYKIHTKIDEINYLILPK